MYELSNSFDDAFVRAVMIGGIIGGICGGIVGTIVYIKMKKDINETIKEIEELTKE